jgi:hypothetical protein
MCPFESGQGHQLSSEFDHDPPCQRWRERVHQLQEPDHADIGFCSVALDRVDDLRRTFCGRHFALWPRRGHRGVDDRRQCFDDMDAAVAEIVTQRLRKASQAGFGRTIDRAARARRDR